MAKSKSAASGKKSAKAAGPKKVNVYTKFMGDEIKRVKAAHPNLDHKQAFKKAAENWAKSPLNPKNKA